MRILGAMSWVAWVAFVSVVVPDRGADNSRAVLFAKVVVGLSLVVLAGMLTCRFVSWDT